MKFSKRDKFSIGVLATFLAISTIILTMPEYALYYKAAVAVNMMCNTLYTASSIKKHQDDDDE